MKRQNFDSDTDSDDISKVLNGLKRQTEDDILSSDTSFCVQRAIAAGTAVIENSGPNKLQSSVATFSNGSCNRKRKADYGGSDDEIMITKYVPGEKPQNKCQLCPKCNRRKRSSIPTSSPAKMPRKDFSSTGYTSISGSRSGSSATKSSVKIKEDGYESESFVPEGKVSRRANAAYAHAWDVKVADYEVIELAAEHTNRSSVLLLASEAKSGELKDKSETDEVLLLSDDAENGAVREPKKSGSFWLSSVERLFQFLNPRSSPEASDEKIRISEGMSKGDVEVELAEQRSSSGEESETFVKESVSLENTSTTDERRSESLGQRSESAGGRNTSFGKTTEAIGNVKVLFGKTSETTEETSAFHVNTLDNVEPNSNCISNTSNFASSLLRSRNGQKRDFQSLMKKAVLEEVIDHAIELKNSGKELKHRCVSSC